MFDFLEVLMWRWELSERDSIGEEIEDQLLELYETEGNIITLQSIPPEGDMFSMQEFVRLCNDQLLVNYDGYGHYSLEKEMTNVTILPSDVTTGLYNDSYPFVVWFNR
jgi:hypothetical protein